MPLPRPPAVPGLPLIGNGLQFRKDPLAVFRRGYESFGPIFAIRLGPTPSAVLVGAEHHRFFFADHGGTLSVPEVYKFMIPMFGKVGNAAEEAEYQEQRTIIKPAFRGENLGHYIAVMVAETEEWLDTLGDSGEIDLWSTFQRLSMYVAAGALMGSDFRQRMVREFWSLYRDLAGGMEFVLPPNLPLPRFRRRDEARRKLQAMIAPIVSQRRAHPDGHDDFIQHLAEARYTNGQLMPEETVVSIILMLVFGGYETTAAQMGWTLVQLLQHPDYLQTVLDEQALVLDDQASRINPGTVQRLQRLEWAVKESERMRPVTTMLTRYVAKTYQRGGYEIPKGWNTILCPALSHRLPEIFSNPDTYDPERFGPERAEDRKTAYSLMNFSGGLHKCTGVHFAYSEIKVTLSLLLQRYTLELVDPDPQPDYGIGISRPAPPCLVRYRRRPATERSRRLVTQPVVVGEPAAVCPYQHQPS